MYVTEVRVGKEIERKFLLKSDRWKHGATGTHYRQGYLSSAKERTVRVRTGGGKAFLTIKGVTVGAVRAEYEYEIPFADGVAMLETLAEKPLIEKNRYAIEANGLVWEVDEFLGVNQGLVVAEVELAAEDQRFEKPSWIGEEVTGDPRYFNANLASHPYATWADRE